MKDTMKARLQERVRVYRDSPGLPATYVELAQLLEDILEIASGEEKRIGFNKTIK